MSATITPGITLSAAIRARSAFVRRTSSTSLVLPFSQYLRTVRALRLPL